MFVSITLRQSGIAEAVLQMAMGLAPQLKVVRMLKDIRVGPRINNYRLISKPVWPEFVIAPTRSLSKPITNCYLTADVYLRGMLNWIGRNRTIETGKPRRGGGREGP